MKILFTTNPSSTLSRTILKVTGDPCSHVAMEFAGGFVIHSNVRGVNVEWRSTFRAHNTVVRELAPPSAKFRDELEDPKRIDRMMLRYEHSAYDTAALMFLGAVMFARRFGVPLPKQNLWQMSGMFICSEWVTEYVDGKADSMITPYGLWKRLESEGWT